MTRAHFQVLVFPFRIIGSRIEYALLKRTANTGGYWQAVAGGGEEGETPLEAAKRETLEEAGITACRSFVQLDSLATVPFVNIASFSDKKNCPLVIPEYAFGVDSGGVQLTLSREHTEIKWLSYEDAHSSLKWESNRNALWELNYRLTRK